MGSFPGFGAAVVRAIERAPVLRAASHDTLDRLLSAARIRTVRRGEHVRRQGIEDDHLDVVVTGFLKRHRVGSDGREIVLDVPGPGDIVGLIEVLDGHPPCHGATALSTTDILVVPGSALREGFRQDVRFAAAIARHLSDDVRTRERDLVQVVTRDARSRVADRLVALAEIGVDETGAVVAELSQEELASWAGVSRESAAKTLHELRERGAIRTGRRRISIDDVEDLRRIATGDIGIGERPRSPADRTAIGEDERGRIGQPPWLAHG